MKICSIRIKGYNQFQDTFLDFTNPITKEPVSKVCFIGKNGTGKSTILKIINNFLSNIGYYSGIPFLAVHVRIENQDVIVFSSSHFSPPIKPIYFLKKNINSVDGWFEDITTESNSSKIKSKINHYQQFLYSGDELTNINRYLQLLDNSNDLLIYSPSESSNNSYLKISDVPSTNINHALGLFKNFPFHHTVWDENVAEFWRLLIYLIKKRDNDREIFETKPDNLQKTKSKLIKEFEKENPKILDKLAILWNKILDNAGLEFDAQNANNPIQLNDNLLAYICLKETKERINYNQLSTGIRNFIFRVGHIYSLFFNREIKRGFLLIDEPENSLFPDFLFDLIETYQELLKDINGENNSQFFVSTHNPIIAAQFEPEERVILEWDKHGIVKSYKGVSPAGDDPNDVLTNDFKLSHLMGKVGQEMWKKYLELRNLLRNTDDDNKKQMIMSEINKIGSDYNF